MKKLQSRIIFKSTLYLIIEASILSKTVPKISVYFETKLSFCKKRKHSLLQQPLLNCAFFPAKLLRLDKIWGAWSNCIPDIVILAHQLRDIINNYGQFSRFDYFHYVAGVLLWVSLVFPTGNHFQYPWFCNALWFRQHQHIPPSWFQCIAVSFFALFDQRSKDHFRSLLKFCKTVLQQWSLQCQPFFLFPFDQRIK